AYAASSTIVVVSGQIKRELIGVDRGSRHEVTDQLDTIRPVTKWAARILQPQDVPATVHEAFRQLKTGRPRPVEIEIPPETLAEEADIELLEPANPLRPAASAEQIQTGAEVLRHARKLLIIAGGGVIASKASAALQTLAEFLQAPVITTAEGKGALSDRHPLALGAMRLRQDPIVEYLAQTDVVLAVGTRLAFPQLFSGQTVVQIDVDAAEVGRNYAPTVGLVGDAQRTLEALYTTLVATTPPRPSRQADIEALKLGRRASPHANLQPLAGFLTAIRNAMPDAGVVIVVNDNAFGNGMRDQRDRFQGRVYGAELHNPDFMQLAAAYGARGARARTAEELEATLKAALGINAPTLIEVPCGPMPYPY